MFDVVKDITYFCLEFVPVMSTMEKYNFMQHMLSVGVEIKTNDSYIGSLANCFLYMDSIREKFYIKKIYEEMDSTELVTPVSDLIKLIPAVWEHCVKCERVLFDILQKIKIIDEIDLIDSIVECDDILQKYDRVGDGFLILQLGGVLHINPFIRLLSIVQRHGWSYVGIESVLPMGVSDYVSEEVCKLVSDIAHINLTIQSFERCADCDDIIVIYLSGKSGPETPYTVIPINTFYKSYMKYVDDLMNNVSISSFISELFRSTPEEFTVVSCLEEMFCSLGTSNRLPDINTFKRLCTGYFDDDTINKFYDRYNIDCTNTAIVYNIVETLYLHVVNLPTDKKFMEGVQCLYNIESFTDILKNGYLDEGLLSLIVKYVKQSMRLLALPAYGYLYEKDKSFITDLGYMDGNYYKYFDSKDPIGYNIDDTTTVCKIILAASNMHVNRFRHIEIRNLLPICKYFFTQKWHLVDLVKPLLGVEDFRLLSCDSDDLLIFDLKLSDIHLNLTLPLEQRKLHNKYAYQYSIVNMDSSNSIEGVDYFIKVLDRLFNRGIFNDSEKLVYIPLLNNNYISYTRPDAKVMYLVSNEDGDINATVPITSAYNCVNEGNFVNLSTGITYDINVENDKIYLDLYKKNKKALCIGKGIVFNELSETSIFDKN